jgi:heat shock protein HtpX
MAGLTALFVSVGGAVGGQAGMTTALLFAGVMNFVMYFASSTMVLRMYKARTVTAAEAPELYEMVGPAAPARRAADAHGRDRAARPAQRLRDRAQPQARGGVRDRGAHPPRLARRAGGVIAHELAHIKNRDMLLQTMTATLAGAISNLAWFGMFAGGSDDEDGGSPWAG